jgi:hypothetical protein
MYRAKEQLGALPKSILWIEALMREAYSSIREKYHSD